MLASVRRPRLDPADLAAARDAALRMVGSDDWHRDWNRALLLRLWDEEWSRQLVSTALTEGVDAVAARRALGKLPLARLQPDEVRE
jgi:hypothetical protein